MIRIYEKNDAIRFSLERALPIFLGENAEVIVTNIDQLAEIKEMIEAQKIPTIFYGFDSEISLRQQGNPAVPYFYTKYAAYFQMPSELIKWRITYDDIVNGRKIENIAVVLASKAGTKKNLIGILLHDIHPGKYGCEKGMETAKKEFGITGTIEEVRAQLEILQNQKISFAKKTMGKKIIPGVFCDMEGTLIVNDSANAEIVRKLEEYAKTRPVTIWTGGELREIYKLLRKNGITKLPLVSKYDFEGCIVETMIDDLEPEKTLALYKIKAKEYVKV